MEYARAWLGGPWCIEAIAPAVMQFRGEQLQLLHQSATPRALPCKSFQWFRLNSAEVQVHQGCKSRRRRTASNLMKN